MRTLIPELLELVDDVVDDLGKSAAESTRLPSGLRLSL